VSKLNEARAHYHGSNPDAVYITGMSPADQAEVWAEIERLKTVVTELGVAHLMAQGEVERVPNMTTYVADWPTCSCGMTFPTGDALDNHIDGKPHRFARPDRFCSVCVCGLDERNVIHAVEWWEPLGRDDSHA
jgi:hypothetical protein